MYIHVKYYKKILYHDLRSQNGDSDSSDEINFTQNKEKCIKCTNNPSYINTKIDIRCPNCLKYIHKRCTQRTKYNCDGINLILLCSEK